VYEVSEEDGRVAIEHVHTDEELKAALKRPRAVLYKHSPRCGVSLRTMSEMEKFAEQMPDIPVFMVDVVADRGLSSAIAEHFEIAHQSPQAIVLEEGQPTWHASHFQISARRLEKEVGSNR
jgi:bacillithiol system protein YtxJ